eukprot:evm.model.scf_417.2 EVM.evm.TU.scf_417.2   scf_417:40755-41224(-)
MATIRRECRSADAESSAMGGRRTSGEARLWGLGTGSWGACENQETLQRDLKVMEDALRSIPTPQRAALAIQGLLRHPEVQVALRTYGTGAELGPPREGCAPEPALGSGPELHKSP